MSVMVRVLYNRLPAAALKLKQRSGQASQQSAYRIRDDAKTRVAVASGETRDHIEAIKAGAFTWNVVSTRPSTDGSFNVPQLLEYGGANHPAQPYLTPAAEAERSRFLDEMDAVLDQLV